MYNTLMAGPITHIAIAERLYPHFFAQRDPAAFYIGTSFPDIRQPAQLDRDSTHSYNVSGRDIRGADDFEAGRLLHSLLDEVQQNYLEQSEIYTYLHGPHNVAVAKLLEDEQLYLQVKSWPIIRSYFNSYNDAELEYGVSKAQATTWHHALQAYFAQAPTDESRDALSAHLQESMDHLTAINAALSKARTNLHISGLVQQATKETVKILEEQLS